MSSDARNITAAAVRGGCLCGAVRFEVTGPLRDVFICHCSLCRRSGTGPAAYTAAAHESIVFDRDDDLAWYIDANGRSRGFCRICGSSLFWRSEAGTMTSIGAGSLEPPTGLRVARHIHVAARGDWEPVPTDAPAHVADSASPLLDGHQ